MYNEFEGKTLHINIILPKYIYKNFLFFFLIFVSWCARYMYAKACVDRICFLYTIVPLAFVEISNVSFLPTD